VCGLIAGSRRIFAGGPRGSLSNPFLQIRNIFFGERFVFAFGHPHFGWIVREDAMDKKTVAGVAGDNRRARFAASQDGIAVIESQSAGRPGLGRMAVIAVRGQNGLNVLLIEGCLFERRRLLSRCRLLSRGRGGDWGEEVGKNHAAEQQTTNNERRIHPSGTPEFRSHL
jgi:hypothetical protein